MADRLPYNGSVDAIYVPGLCLTHDKQRLTALNIACMEGAIQQMQAGAKHFVFSGCYDGEVLERELTLRRKLANSGRVRSVKEISGIVNTEDELTKLASMLNALDAKSVLLVSDEYHMPRLVLWTQLYLTGIEIFHMSVRPPAYEFTWEPSLIKVIRSGIKPLWILWNVLLYMATPFLLRK
ncbi:MAG: YdcF family protein [Parcubacteria group bacterium]|nr:YdcF family protein [Parcubacteria group bacterium]